MLELYELSADDLAKGLHAGDYTNSEVVEAMISRLKEVDPKLHSAISATFDKARLVAEHLDIATNKYGVKRAPLSAESAKNWKPAKLLGEICEVGLNSNGELHPYAGVPVVIDDASAIKDALAILGISAPFDSPPFHDPATISKLKAAGLPMLGCLDTNNDH